MNDREKALEAALLRFIADEEAGNLGHTDVGADWLIMAREAIATPAAPWSPPPKSERPEEYRCLALRCQWEIVEWDTLWKAWILHEHPFSDNDFTRFAPLPQAHNPAAADSKDD